MTYAVISGYNLGLVLRQTGTNILAVDVGGSGNTLAVRYSTTLASGAAIPSGQRLFGGSTDITLSTPLAAGDTLRFEVEGQGTSMVGRVFQNNVQVAGGAVVAAARVITAGQPGLFMTRAGSQIGYAQSWKAGDFQSAVQPPTPPTGPQGAFTVRTT